MNKVLMIGRLAKEPELRTTQGGVSVTTFSLAVTRTRDREKSDFYTVVTWRGLAEICAKHLVKGQQVAICGEVQTRTYEAKDGTKRYITEIVADEVEFLQKPKEHAQENAIQSADSFEEFSGDLPF